MRVFALLAILALAACAEDQSHLDRWDDPRVIQVIDGWSLSACSHGLLALRGTEVIANLERIEGPPHCIDFDGLIRFQRENNGFRFLYVGKTDGVRYSCRLIPHHRTAIGCPELAPLPEAPFPDAGEDLVRALNPNALAPEQLCFSLSVDQSLLVSDVFAMRNAVLDQGVSCLVILQELALTADGRRFPERERR